MSGLSGCIGEGTGDGRDATGPGSWAEWEGMSLTGPGLWLPPTSQRQKPDLPHSGEAQVAILLGLEEPPGAGWSQGWKNWSSYPPPTILEFEERVSAGTGGSLHSTWDETGRGVPEERRQGKHRMGGIGTRQEPLWPVSLDLLVDFRSRRVGFRCLYSSQSEMEDSLLVSRKACSQTSRRTSPMGELDDCQEGVKYSLRRKGESGFPQGMNPGSVL